MLRGSFEVIFGGMNGIAKLKYSLSSKGHLFDTQTHGHKMD